MTIQIFFINPSLFPLEISLRLHLSLNSFIFIYSKFPSLYINTMINLDVETYYCKTSYLQTNSDHNFKKSITCTINSSISMSPVSLQFHNWSPGISRWQALLRHYFIAFFFKLLNTEAWRPLYNVRCFVFY